MKKTLYVLALGATVISPVAFADVSIYGRAHVSLDLLDDGKDYRELNLSSNSSRLGFKADTKINDDLTAFAQIEQQINFTSGDQDGKSVDFATRDTFVGVKGEFGQVRVGKFDSPFKAARNPINFFGDQLGDIRNVTRAGNLRFDERNPNTVEYQSPKFAGGFTAAAALSLHEGTNAGHASDIKDANGNVITEKGDSKKDKAYDLALGYKEGPIDVALAYERYDEDAARGKRDGIRLAAAYKLTPELNLAALYQILKHDNDNANPDAQVFGVAADYKIAPNTYLRGQYLLRDVDTTDADASLITVGVEHRLSKALRVYGNFATVLNDKNSQISPWEQARSTDTVKAFKGEDAKALSLGLRYDF